MRLKPSLTVTSGSGYGGRDCLLAYYNLWFTSVPYSIIVLSAVDNFGITLYVII